MAKIVLLALALVGIPACVSTQTPETVSRDGAFIHITAGVDNPHRVAMALQMASIMAEDRDVLVYFDIKGIQGATGRPGRTRDYDCSLSRMPESSGEDRSRSGRRDHDCRETKLLQLYRRPDTDPGLLKTVSRS
jgi:hypothetical protein